MLTYSMGVSIDGFIADRNGSFDWSAPSDELFDFQLDHVASLGGYLLGRRLYETMRVWDTDPSLRATESGARFASVWSALPKVVFSRTLDQVDDNARLATGSVADEVAATLAATDEDVSIGGAGMAAQAIDLDLLDELRILRHPVIVGGGIPLLPPTLRDIPLELVEVRRFESSVVFERYRRTPV